MTRAAAYALIMLFALVLATRIDVAGQQGVSDGARYDPDGRLLYPADYREWVYLTSGLGMTYGPAAQAAGRPPMFDNVFVNRESYRSFLATGRWPERTIFALEIRTGDENVSINNGGRTQGAIRALEVAVKDSSRFPDTTWGYFEFGAPPEIAPAAARLPATASCYACHRNHAAVEQTFVQFYPTLMDVARAKGTVRADYDPARKP
jgi:hypothetical protein